MSRLWETCTAATNCPRFLNPCDAVCRLVPAGSRPCSLLDSLVFCDSSSEGVLSREEFVPGVPELPRVIEEGSEARELPIPPPAPPGGPPPCPPPCCA